MSQNPNKNPQTPKHPPKPTNTTPKLNPHNNSHFQAPPTNHAYSDIMAHPQKPTQKPTKHPQPKEHNPQQQFSSTSTSNSYFSDSSKIQSDIASMDQVKFQKLLSKLPELPRTLRVQVINEIKSSGTPFQIIALTDSTKKLNEFMIFSCNLALSNQFKKPMSSKEIKLAKKEAKRTLKLMQINVENLKLQHKELFSQAMNRQQMEKEDLQSRIAQQEFEKMQANTPTSVSTSTTSTASTEQIPEPIKITPSKKQRSCIRENSQKPNPLLGNYDYLASQSKTPREPPNLLVRQKNPKMPRKPPDIQIRCKTRHPKKPPDQGIVQINPQALISFLMLLLHLEMRWNQGHPKEPPDKRDRTHTKKTAKSIIPPDLEIRQNQGHTKKPPDKRARTRLEEKEKTNNISSKMLQRKFKTEVFLGNSQKEIQGLNQICKHLAPSQEIIL